MSDLYPFLSFFRRKAKSAPTLAFALKGKKCGRCRYLRNVIMGLFTLPFTLAAIGGFFALAYMPRVALDNLAFFGRHTPVGCLALNALHEGARKGPVFQFDEPEVGLIAVGMVVKNRLELGFRQGNAPAPQSLCDVVWAQDQFSWTLYSASRIFDLPADDEARFRRAFWASTQVLLNSHKAQAVAGYICDADHYLNPSVANPLWQYRMRHYGFYGNHLFMADTARYPAKRQALLEKNGCTMPENDVVAYMATR
jgi:hypothetical protein